MQADRLAQMLRKHPQRVKTYRLCFGDVDGAEEVLGEWDRPESTEMKELAETIVEYAQAHCDEMSTNCKYRVLGFPADSERAIVTATMRQQSQGTPMAMEGLGNLEDASGHGLVSQSIRHTEAMMQMFIKVLGQMLNVQGHQVDQLQRALDKAMKREADVMELARVLATQAEDSVSQERSADRLDRFATVLTEKVGPAVLKEIGLLPDDFQIGDADAKGKLLRLAAGAGDEEKGSE